MRLLNYVAKNTYGETFETTDYAKATENGNKIISTFFTPVDLKTEKEKETARKHVEKVREKYF